jgi:hypothetical protein
LAAIALTDHDTLAGVAAAAAAGEPLGVRVVAGCEFSVRVAWGELHLLGYFLPPEHAELARFLADTRAARRRRGQEMVQRLQRLGVDVAVEHVAAAAGEGAVGRPHVARALVERGVVADIGEAFDRFLGRGRPAFVEKPLPPLTRVTTLVHEVGGVAVAAHLGQRATESEVRHLKDQGVDGLEARHPSHSGAVERRVEELAGRFDLAVTGGSDWHGDTDLGGAHAELGGLDVPLEWLERLERRRAEGKATERAAAE